MKYDAQNSPVIGIDLGTTYSSVARWTGKDADVYSPKGERCLRSVVYYDEKNDKYIYGNAAFMSGILNPDNVIVGVKRLMDDNNIKIKLGSKIHSPVEISSMILKNIYDSIQNMFPSGVYNSSGVVVTVPYYFKAHQFQNTAEAAKLAGLDLLGIIQEPIAAAFAYGLHHSETDKVRDENILVFDLGGGTFDLTIINIKENQDELLFNVIGIGGDDRLGGLDFDKAFMDYIIQKEGIDFESVQVEKLKKVGRQKLLDTVIKSKEILSSTDSTYIAVPDVIPGVHIDAEYTREDFEKAIELYLEKIKRITKETMINAGVKATDINKVIKVGGSSKISIIDEIIKEECGDGKTYSDIDPSLCVAQGAAIYAAYLSKNLDFNKNIKIETAVAHALGVEDAEGNFITLIEQNQKTPAKETLTFTTDEDNQTEVDVEVYQGTKAKARDNAHVGTVRVTGLKPFPKYQLEIMITFEVGSSQEVKVTIQEAISGINKVEVLKLI
ncbi:molecular chaperone DnaK [Clostridium sp. MF28]|uniref:Hsp70 family protein n=1 Tax=Clostridium TaxID=1485 RepID=UPI000CF991A6|nr:MULTISPECIES: Hsp70 family protein [Clostridium]AVK47516.1 molecular chaperone DnaK [Clostridium sp. MF28]PSM58688.1 Hsp70 family protein [Clostridium diolis]